MASDNVDLIVVADFFANELIGGGELTLEAILDACPFKIERIKSNEITERFIQVNKDKHWIFGNFAGVSRSNLIEIIRTVRKYSVIEMDYKYCRFRSSHIHKIQTGQECDCNQQDCGRFILGMFNRASQVFFMSEGQLNEYKRLFPIMEKMAFKLVVQGSTFSKKDLNLIKELIGKSLEEKINSYAVARPGYPAGQIILESAKQKADKWLVLSGGSAIKGQKETEEYCKANNIPYDLVGGNVGHELFLLVMSCYKGLIFHPVGFDTNPRITIEAKLLGLELDLNDNVQNKYDSWFNQDIDSLYDYLFDLPTKFWERFKI